MPAASISNIQRTSKVRQLLECSLPSIHATSIVVGGPNKCLFLGFLTKTNAWTVSLKWMEKNRVSFMTFWSFFFDKGPKFLAAIPRHSHFPPYTLATFSEIPGLLLVAPPPAPANGTSGASIAAVWILLLIEKIVQPPACKIRKNYIVMTGSGCLPSTVSQNVSHVFMCLNLEHIGTSWLFNILFFFWGKCQNPLG